MVHAKYLFEEKLKKSGLTYVIHRPTGYFYDILKVFKPMVKEKGKVTLLGKNDVLGFFNWLKKNGKDAVIRFSKFTLTDDMVGDTVYGDMSFDQYIKDNINKDE